MKEIIYGVLILSFAVLMGLYFSYTNPETITLITILLGSVIAAVGTYVASYRAQKYLQDRSEKRIYIKSVFYPLFRELEENFNRLKTGRSVELTTNIWVYTINSPEYLGLEKPTRKKLENIYEKIKAYNTTLKSVGKGEYPPEVEKLEKEISKAMKFLEKLMKEK